MILFTLTDYHPNFAPIKSIKFQINYLVFITSMREDNFKLFDKIVIPLVKWFVIFDQYNYARWLSVHIQHSQQFNHHMA